MDPKVIVVGWKIFQILLHHKQQNCYVLNMTSFAGFAVLESDVAVVGLRKIGVVAGVLSGEDDGDWQMEFGSWTSLDLLSNLCC